MTVGAFVQRGIDPFDTAEGGQPVCVHEVAESPSELYGVDRKSVGGVGVPDCYGAQRAPGRPIEVHAQPRGTSVDYDPVLCSK